MHLLFVMAFGLLIWRTDQELFAPPLGSGLWTVVFVIGQACFWWLVAWGCSRWALHRMRRGPSGTDSAQAIYHRSSSWLGLAVFAGFGADVLLTDWPQLVSRLELTPYWFAFGDLLVVAPYLITILGVWHAQYPIERAIRNLAATSHTWEGRQPPRVWRRNEYLSFHFRYQMLTVVVPMVIVLLTYRLCDHHRSSLVETLLFPWAPDAILGLVAATTFVTAPILLKSIWSTSSLEAGPLRTRLESAMANPHTGLRCRDILVWNSHGMVINAAVMGMFARLRYVLLSDGLLEALNEDEIEAVFGHEAGHVRHHHLPYFLLFAVSSILLVSGVMEIIIRLSQSAAPSMQLSETAMQGIGLGLIALVWGVAFGWMSRRFERQADAFGAQCVGALLTRCGEACSVHLHEGRAPGHRICAAAAKVFVAALDRVAALNGMPLEERNWRHSSIASRIRFLTAQAGDPVVAEGFRSTIVWIKRALWGVVLIGSVVAAVYCLSVPHYRAIIWQNTIGPLRGLGGA
ncbi:MAG: M48 family metalloprotease [bacterium]|nr:M48 family metalloprotease [bacterium]